MKWMSAALIAGVLAGCTGHPSKVLNQLPAPLLRVPRPQVLVQAPPPLVLPPAPVVRQASRDVTIVVDAGHGGNQPGTLGTGASNVPEKSLTLAIATALSQELRTRGANVEMTRTGDWFVALGKRADIGNSLNAELFVSIHIDAARNTDASGMTVYLGRNASVGSLQAAQHIQQALRQAGFETRGVRRANYQVLRESNGPAVLVECGFLSNFGDARMLNQPYNRQRIAAAIAEGIADYFGW